MSSEKLKPVTHLRPLPRPASADEGEDEDEPTEVTKLQDLLERKMAKSCEKLDDVARKGDTLKRRLRRRPGSVSKMQAVLKRPSPTEPSEPAEK